jgi:glycosyltransferase involved in cell wall biosynthesis
MLTVIIPTRESERPLLPTLAALVPAAAAGLVREVVLADAGSRDATGEVADVAGCRLLVSDEPLGARLAAAVGTARAQWLLFLQPGTLLESDWIADVSRFMELAELAPADNPQAAVFRRSAGSIRARPQLMEAIGLLLAALRAPQAQQGLLIFKPLYQELGGHRADVADPETDLLRRLGRRRIAILRTAATSVRANT